MSMIQCVPLPPRCITKGSRQPVKGNPAGGGTLMQVSQQSPVATASTPLSTPGDTYSHFYCITSDAPSNAVLYWMGSYDPETVTFRLAEAVGTFRLDMGDTIYAPNLQEHAKGRCILWAWVQERRSVGKYDFAGSMASPRVLLRRRGRLIQQPLRELAQVSHYPPGSKWWIAVLDLSGLVGVLFKYPANT